MKAKDELRALREEIAGLRAQLGALSVALAALSSALQAAAPMQLFVPANTTTPSWPTITCSGNA